MMRLYYYSNTENTFMEAKWVRGRFIAGILLGAILLMGVVKSVGYAMESSSVDALMLENGILQRQVSLLSPRVHALEMNVGQFSDQLNAFDVVLRSVDVAGNRSSFTMPVVSSLVSVPSPALAKRD
ncbi:MAG: hypothetical protein WEB37_10360 [Bacteroidota bacterium]